MPWGKKMKDHDSLLFGLWKKFSFFFNASFNFRTKLSFSWKATVQKYPKGVVTCWLTHNKVPEHVLYCYLKILEALNYIFININESEVRGIRNVPMHHKVLLCICLMANILFWMCLIRYPRLWKNKAPFK